MDSIVDAWAGRLLHSTSYRTWDAEYRGYREQHYRACDDNCLLLGGWFCVCLGRVLADQIRGQIWAVYVTKKIEVNQDNY